MVQVNFTEVLGKQSNLLELGELLLYNKFWLCNKLLEAKDPARYHFVSPQHLIQGTAE